VKRFEMPSAPSDQAVPVKAWAEAVVIPTFLPMPPDKNPMFLEKRVYQGSSGRVYPLPFFSRISTEPVDHSWQAAHIENEFVRVMVLPEIGGRVHVGLDKTNGYDFFYRQNVIKPALVGLAGPWISGGVEFNWPQHHRPATFMPVETRIEKHADGSRTIWCSDHDPMNRLKGMHGICLHPGKSYVELKVRLYNRTPFTQTFLWWANAAVHVHELYQSFFPPDVRHVADHAKRAVSRFPLCDGTYYGVNYGERAKNGVPLEERPAKFVPSEDYAPNDLGWYANIPVPTSYMALDSSEDFMGGYDHKRHAGMVHIADHHIAPGKKQWTWGNHEFGYAWDRNLTEDDGPYVELMAGAFTDNQPDFSFLGPWETRSFSQYWYPIQEIGPAQKANLDAAVSLCLSDRRVRIGVCSTQTFIGATVRLENKKLQGKRVWVRDLAPGKPLVETSEIDPDCREADFEVVVVAKDGREILRYTPRPTLEPAIPPPATEPPLPEELQSNDELYVTGLHLEQYRHATCYPEAYWREALRRDAGDSRCNNAMGLWHLRRGEFVLAEECFRRAIGRLTQRNPNPYDGEPCYNLGLTLRYLDRDEEAYKAFNKAAWNSAWQSAAALALLELDVKRGDWDSAIQRFKTALRGDSNNSNARNLATVVLRALGMEAEAIQLLDDTLAFDPLDCWARYLKTNAIPADNHLALDLSFDYARCGLFHAAIKVLTAADRSAGDGSVPIVLYALAHFYSQIGDPSTADELSSEAAQACPDYCFPSRLEELIILQAAVRSKPRDARAPYYLGNLLYDRRRHREAIALWEQSALLEPSFSVVWRNLGIGYFNALGDEGRARSAFDKAIDSAPADTRVLYERDQLWKRLGESPQCRLLELQKYAELIDGRDDLSVELATLYNQTRQHDQALSILQSRKFQPWEGGEGMALGQHVRVHLMLGKRALAGGNPGTASQCFETALTAPENLGEAKHQLANQSDIYFWLGTALDALGDNASARQSWERAAHHKGDFQGMSVKQFSEMTYYNALALKCLQRANEAEILLHSLLSYAQALAKQEATIDYFATSLPAMLLFNDNLQKRNKVTALFLEAQAWLGLGDLTKGQHLITQVLGLDQNHPLAADLLAELELLPSAMPANR
jgi:tetratricopeptide (TPR) repeat protein